MTEWADKFSNRLYRDIWGFIVPYLRVPKEPPSLPLGDSDSVESFKPAEGFLRYLKLWFWILCILIDIALSILWIAICLADLTIGLLLLPVFVVIMFLPDIIVFIGIHLRYDTTWYVLTDRAIRIRRGIWIIHETTLSFENVQNVSVDQGPVQRYFGIADVTIETAGGGEAKQQGNPFGVSNQGVIEGIADAARVRDIILSRMKQSQTTGLGDLDEHDEGQAHKAQTAFTEEHLVVLRDIRNETIALKSAG